MTFDPFTLFVALDATGTAYGEINIDDGRTDVYTHGSFLRRKFEFINFQLRSEAFSVTAV